MLKRHINPTRRAVKLLIITGPPASGKLTIGTHVANHTGFALFHNHLSVDLAKALFAFGTVELSNLSWDVRITTFRHGAAAGLPGMIFTWAYSDPDFRPQLERLEATAQECGIGILTTHVDCSRETRERRVISESRKRYGKVLTIEHLGAAGDMLTYAALPSHPAYSVNSERHSAEDCAQNICTHFGLRRSEG